ncbi:MAG: hypothetical protein WBV22_01075 [Anaerolineaceae bacterium]
MKCGLDVPRGSNSSPHALPGIALIMINIICLLPVPNANVVWRHGHTLIAVKGNITYYFKN